MRCFEKRPGRIHYHWGFDRMVLKNIKNIVKTVIGKRSFQSATFKEIVNWLHELEFLIIKVVMFIIVIHHLYAYTLKAVF